MNRKMVCILAAGLALLAPGPVAGLEINDRLSIGGFGIAHYSQQSGSTADTGTFEFHPIYLNFNFRPNDKITNFLELEFEHLPNVKSAGSKGEIKVERAYIEYNHSDHHNIKLGKFFAPAGVWYATHWRMLTPTYDRVIMFQNQASMMPSHQVGVQYFGSLGLNDNVDFSYASWLTLGNLNVGTDDRTMKFNNPGANLELVFYEKYKLGVAGQILSPSVNLNRSQDSLLGFAQGKFFNDKLVLTGEYMQTKMEPAFGSTTPHRDLSAYYIGAEYQFIDNWYAYGRYDRGDDISRSGGSITNPTAANDPNTVIWTGALTWTPLVGTQLRAEFIDYNFTKTAAPRDFTKFQFSVGQMF